MKVQGARAGLIWRSLDERHPRSTFLPASHGPAQDEPDTANPSRLSREVANSAQADLLVHARESTEGRQAFLLAGPPLTPPPAPLLVRLIKLRTWRNQQRPPGDATPKASTDNRTLQKESMVKQGWIGPAWTARRRPCLRCGSASKRQTPHAQHRHRSTRTPPSWTRLDSRDWNVTDEVLNEVEKSQP